MKLQDVHHFFDLLGRRINTPVNVIITGGAAAIAFGVSRATEDIDFEVKLSIHSAKRNTAWQSLEIALSEVQKLTGITPQFSEDIDRWSSIALPTKRSQRLWKFGTVTIRVLHPLDWSVGKLTRYLASDESDVVEVFKKKKVGAYPAARVWGQALAQSPASSAQFLFRNNVKSFFETHARDVWGVNVSAAQLFNLFLQTGRRLVRKPSKK